MDAGLLFGANHNVKNQASLQMHDPLRARTIGMATFIDIAVDVLTITFCGHTQGIAGAQTPEQIEAALERMLSDHQEILSFACSHEGIERVELRIAQPALIRMRDTAVFHTRSLYSVAFDLGMQLVLKCDHLQMHRDNHGHYWGRLTGQPPYDPEALFADAMLYAEIYGRCATYTLAELTDDVIHRTAILSGPELASYLSA
jgi:hypothetical protein